MKWNVGFLFIYLTKNFLICKSFKPIHNPMRLFHNNNDIYKYRSNARKLYKKEKKYEYLVEDHHCIPRQWKNHEVIERLDFDINSSDNLLIMPNNKGKKYLNLDPNTIVHQGGHSKYNLFVKKNLDEINTKCYEECRYEFWLFLHYLKKNIQNNEDNIPWK